MIVNYKILGTDNLIKTAVLPWAYSDEDFLEEDFIRQKSNLSCFEFLRVNEEASEIFFKQGSWILNKDLIIPEGFVVIARESTVIDLINGSMILSYSALDFRGSPEEPVRITSLDGTGEGVAVFNTEKDSYFENVIFENLVSPSKNGWELSGAITFNEAPFVMDFVLISNMKAEDSLDVVNSKYIIKNSNFENCFSDCIDDDFGEGIIENVGFEDCGNDCLDFSGADVTMKDVTLFDVGDKGLSAGEKSFIHAYNLSVDGNVNIAIASKDLSEIFLDGTDILNATYAFAVYRKKAEYGSSKIEAINTDIYDLEYIVEKDSSLSINDLIILSDEKNVYDKLYGEDQ